LAVSWVLWSLLQLGLHLGLQLFQLTFAHMGGDVVIGVKAAVGGHQAVADALTGRQRGQLLFTAEDA
jgi:hypothetical protein